VSAARRTGAREARRLLILAGFSAPLSADCAEEGSLYGSGPAEQIARLAEVGDYIASGDAREIGAAWLLEQSGCERGQEQLELPVNQRRPRVARTEIKPS
jgi:hypothetical protein